MSIKKRLNVIERNVSNSLKGHNDLYYEIEVNKKRIRTTVFDTNGHKRSVFSAVTPSDVNAQKNEINNYRRMLRNDFNIETKFTDYTISLYNNANNERK